MQSISRATISCSATITTIRLTPHSSLPDRYKKSQKRKARQQKPQSSNTLQTNKKLSFPKSFPNPILFKPKPQPKTKLQALELVVQELEASAKNGIAVDTGTYSSILEACFHLHAADLGTRIHHLIPPKILRNNTGVASKLLRLYAANGKIDDAHELFDRMSSRDESAFVWNSLISGYADSGQFEDALALYFQMEEDGVQPDRFTFPRALKACSGINMIQIGEEIHRHIVRSGFCGDGCVLNALVDMYAKCGDIVMARKVFDKIKSRDLVSWNSMITGYLHHGLLGEALSIFREMLVAGVEPDEVTLSSVICGATKSLRISSEVHGWILRGSSKVQSLSVDNALISLYSYHGKLVQARWIFDRLLEKDIVSWNSIISAHSKDYLALEYFNQMQRTSSINPDHITFVSVMSACAQLGLVEEGERLFSLMRDKFGISPIMEHYACMVNLYGRAGNIVKAYEIVTRTMEFEAGSTVWGAMLYACYLHGNVEIGEVCAQKLFELEPDNEHNFELLMKIYERLGRLDDFGRVKRMLKDRGLDS